MTIKVVELQVEIPDLGKDKAPLDNEQLCNAIALYLEPFQVCYRVQIPEIKVTKTSPSFYPHKSIDDVKPLVNELHDEGDEPTKEEFNTNV